MTKRFSVLTLLALLFVPTVTAADPPDTIVLRTAMLPSNEVPPIVGLNATGTATCTIVVKRDDTGLISSGTVDFDINYRGFPAGTTFTGLHIHNGPDDIAAGVVIPTNLGAGPNSVFSPTGTGNIFRRVVVDGTNARLLGFLRGVAVQPQLYYANLHTTVNPGGAIRGQLAASTPVFRTLMVPDQEVPPLAGLAARAVATTTVNLNRDANGAVVSGAVDFDVAYEFPASVTLIGLDIHRGAAGVAGPAIISSGLGAGNSSVTVPAGSGNIYRRADVPSTDTAGLDALRGMLSDPSQFYVNMRTTANPGGAVRGQFSANSYVFLKPLSPALEVPPLRVLDTEGTALITARVTRDVAGNITAGSVEFNTDFSIGAGTTTLTGMHIHNAAEGTNGAIVIDSGLGSTPSNSGAGNVTRTATIAATDTAALTALRGLIESPDRYYVNVRTTTNPDGLLRGQLERTTLAYRVAMRPDNEVPPVTGLAAGAAATIVARIAKNDQGAAIQGTVDFDVAHQFSGPTTFTGVRLHNAPVGVNGPAVIDSGIAGLGVTSDTGAGVLFRRATIVAGSPEALAALDGLGKNPEQFYVNLQTTANPGGAVRAQLAANTYYFAQAGGGDGTSASITLTNPSATISAGGLLYFLNSEGKPLDGVVNRAVVPFVIPPAATATFSTNSQVPAKAGYARVVSADVLVPGLALSVPGFGTASTGASPQDAFAFRAPVFRGSSDGSEAGVAVVNISDQTVRVVLSLVNAAGSSRIRFGRTSVFLAPGQQLSRLMGDLFPGLGDFQGTLRIVALGPFPSKTITATVVQFAASQISIVPLTRVTKAEE